MLFVPPPDAGCFLGEAEAGPQVGLPLVQARGHLSARNDTVSVQPTGEIAAESGVVPHLPFPT